MNATPAGTPAPGLGANDYAILEFERLRFGRVGNKDHEILTRFGMTTVAYYNRLRWILEQPEAVAYDAQTVKRLTDIAAKRRAVRTRGTAATGVATTSDPRGVRPMLFGSVLP